MECGMLWWANPGWSVSPQPVAHSLAPQLGEGENWKGKSEERLMGWHKDSLSYGVGEFTKKNQSIKEKKHPSDAQAVTCTSQQHTAAQPVSKKQLFWENNPHSSFTVERDIIGYWMSFQFESAFSPVSPPETLAYT